MSKRVLSAEPTVNSYNTMVIEDTGSKVDVIRVVLLLAFFSVAMFFGWLAFARPLVWWGIMGALVIGLGLVTSYSRLVYSRE